MYKETINNQTFEFEKKLFTKVKGFVLRCYTDFEFEDKKFPIMIEKWHPKGSFLSELTKEMKQELIDIAIKKIAGLKKNKKFLMQQAL